MFIWETWRKGFDAWEAAAAPFFESIMKSPLVLSPAGAVVSAAAKLMAARDEALAQAWGALGLPTRRDQERALHALMLLEGRLCDLEERIDELKGE